MSAQVIGLDRLKRRIREVSAGLEAAGHEAQRETSAQIAQQWQAGVPVDSGALRDSITYDERGAYTDIPYAPLVRTRAGQQAAASAERSFERTAASRLRRALGRFAR